MPFKKVLIVCSSFPSLLLLLLVYIGLTAAAPQASTSSTPNLRIEGPSTTIFEGSITSGPRNISVSDMQNYNYPSYPCNGLNHAANQSPFNTALDALDAAAKSKGFTYDGEFHEEYLDFIIEQIAGYSETESGYWGLLWNWKIPQYGAGLTISGCQQEVRTGDDVLWAFKPSDKEVFLRVKPSSVTVKKGSSVTFTITNGLGGVVQPGATIHGVPADANGKVVISYPSQGYFTFKAKKTGAVRSNIVKVTVTN